MSTLVIGVDPGDSTGVAVLHDGKLLHTYQGPPSQAITLVELVLGHKHLNDEVTVACERFVSGRGRAYTHQPTAQQVVGVMRHVASRYQVDFVEQGAADAWAIADNATLRRLELHQSASDVAKPDADDANMAVRHALLCLARKHATTFDALLKGG